MHVLVTGGAGFIGSHSVEQLLEANIPVRVLDNFSAGSRQNLPSHSLLDIQVGDIRDDFAIHKAMEDITHVLHLAAQVSVQASVDNPPGSCSTNIGGFVNVLQAARLFGVQRMVYASSAAVYGRPARLPLSETDMAQPCSPYGLEKYVNDQYAALFEREFGVSLLGLRYFNVYGPRQDTEGEAGVVAIFSKLMLEGGQPIINGTGKQTRDFVYVDDIVESIMATIGEDIQGIFNVGTGQESTVNECYGIIKSLTNSSCKDLYGAAKKGEQFRSVLDVMKLRKGFDWDPQVSLPEGLKMTVEFFKAQGK